MIVIKLGGSVLKSALEKQDFLKCVAEASVPVLIVHGGGPEINEMCEKLSIASSFLDGQRITSAEVLKVTQMALSGHVNKQIVCSLQKLGRKAVGLSGVDAEIIRCVAENPKLGLVGKPSKINIEFLLPLIRENYVIVLSPVSLFENGDLCNVNADLAAAAVAKSLAATKLLFVTDQNGILDDKNQLINKLTLNEMKQLMSSDIIRGGMKVKARAICEILESAPHIQVEVMNGLDSEALKNTLSGNIVGTVCVNS